MSAEYNTYLNRYEQVIQKHICLYVYSVKSNKFRIFYDASLVEDTMFPNDPRYYIRHYSENSTTEYAVLPDAGKVQHSGNGTFKVWYKEANDSAGVKSLLDAVDIYTSGKIKKAFDTIVEMQNYQDLAHKELDIMM